MAGSRNNTCLGEVLLDFAADTIDVAGAIDLTLSGLARLDDVGDLTTRLAPLRFSALRWSSSVGGPDRRGDAEHATPHPETGLSCLRSRAGRAGG